MKTFGVLGSVFGFFAVALGAFAAHGLKKRMSPEGLTLFETGTKYQMYHALALVLVALLMGRGWNGAGSLAGWAFSAGIVLFSGSLYLLALTGARWMGAVTPLGGVAFLVGWAALAWGLFSRG